MGETEHVFHISLLTALSQSSSVQSRGADSLLSHGIRAHCGNIWPWFGWIWWSDWGDQDWFGESILQQAQGQLWSGFAVWHVGTSLTHQGHESSTRLLFRWVTEHLQFWRMTLASTVSFEQVSCRCTTRNMDKSISFYYWYFCLLPISCDRSNSYCRRTHFACSRKKIF